MADVTMEKIVSLCKRRGFIFPGSEIYGGLSGTWDWGPHGIELKRNVTQLWWRMLVQGRDDMYGVDAALLMNANVWRASGHVDGFNDPLVTDLKTNKRYRADHLLEDTEVDPAGMSLAQMGEAIVKHGIKSPEGNPLSTPQQFNMMLKTHVGASEDAAAVTYLRPETAGGIFVNFKNVVDSIHPKLPFGIAQIGKAFRNEIAPRDFIFRVRELEQMEIEYFIRPSEWQEAFDVWRDQIHAFNDAVGIDRTRVREREIAAEDRAHYSQRTIDFEFDFPFGQKELYGLAYRGDFDLSSHTNASKVDLSYIDDVSGERFLPHVIEPSFGVERTVLALLTSAYTEDELGGEPRTYLKFNKAVAPVKAAVFPLLRNKPQLVEKAREVYAMLKKDIPQIIWDDNGNIGKRYRRQDEIGTPVCITIDFDTLGEGGDTLKDTVTLRDRDTGEQQRVLINELANIIGA